MTGTWWCRPLLGWKCRPSVRLLIIGVPITSLSLKGKWMSSNEHSWTALLSFKQLHFAASMSNSISYCNILSGWKNLFLNWQKQDEEDHTGSVGFSSVVSTTKPSPQRWWRWPDLSQASLKSTILLDLCPSSPTHRLSIVLKMLHGFLKLYFLLGF